MYPISYYPSKNNTHDFLFSIIIPSWNNLALTQLCIESIKKNSHYKHQIILHLNEGNDGSTQWAAANDIDYTHSIENVGICYGMNAAYSLAKAEYIVFMNDDMYACPDWDFYLKEQIDKFPDHLFYISGTLIEPKESGNACVCAPFNFGESVETFKEKELLEKFRSIEKQDWNGASWPPSLMHRKTWDLIGGFSVEFSPGMYSDPDICMKLWQAGVRQFIGVGKSKVYHFMSKSTGKLKKKAKVDGKKTFLNKWGITSRILQKHYLRLGTPYKGALTEPEMTSELKSDMLRNKVKKLFTS